MDMKVTVPERDPLEEEIRGIKNIAQGAGSQGGPRQTQAPVDGAWTYFQALDGLKERLSETQLLEARASLKGPLAESAHSIADVRLMSEAIDAATTPGGQALATFLTQKVLKGLCLNIQTPEQMRESGEDEPNSRTFNSVLPSIATVIYEHGPVGRTLLWEGACGLFPGASEAERRETLKTLIFKFPCDPGEGLGRLENMFEFVMAVDEMNIDEEIDIEALKEKSKPHGNAAQKS